MIEVWYSHKKIVTFYLKTLNFKTMKESTTPPSYTSTGHVTEDISV